MNPYLDQDHERRRQQNNLQVLGNIENSAAIYKAFDYADERETDVSLCWENLLLFLSLRYEMNGKYGII